MEEISISDLWEIFIDNVGKIIIVTILAAILGFCYTKFMVTPMYSANTKILLVAAEKNENANNQNQGNGEITASDLALNQKLIATYQEIIISDTVLRNVIDKLGINRTVGSVSGNIKVTNASSSDAINITVHDSDARIAADIANTIVDVFVEKVKEIYEIKNVTTLDKAVEPSNPYNVSVEKNMLIFGAVGFVLIYAILFVIEYLRVTIKSSDEVEKALNLPVLSIIPLIEGGDDDE